MSFRKLRRIIGVSVIAGACAIAPVLSGCNTGHPEVNITISFDGNDYVLGYKLYRTMYPQTVQHFIELAVNGFYDNTIIHDYTSSTWYGGGYDYVENTEEGAELYQSYVSSFGDGIDGFREYLEYTSKEAEYAELADPAAGKITPTVYKDLLDGKLTQPLNTLIGEFSNNQHKIENGALKSSYGCLKMYYTPKTMDSAQNVRVYLNKTGSPLGVMGNYNYNSATSLFSIQQNRTTTTDSNYCIFGVLKDENPLTELRTAVSNYSAKVGSSKFTLDVNLYVDNRDEYVGANVNEVSYRVTSVPIIIKSVTVTKF